MKKFLALLMVVCMLMGSVALAAQNEQPPKLVSSTAAVTLTDVHARKTVEDAAVAERLTLALMSIEVPATQVLVELFDVAAEGAVDLVLEMEPDQAMPAAVLYTADGTTWTVIDYATLAGKQFQISLPGAATVALLCDNTVVMNVGKPNAPTTTATKEQGSTVNQGSFGTFTPSVTGTLTPSVVPEDTGVATIGGDNQEEKSVPDSNYVKVTTPSSSSEDLRAYEQLAAAQDDIMNNNVGELKSKNGTLAAELDAALKAMGLALTNDQLTVKELFAVNSYGEYAEELDGTNYMEMTLGANLDPNQPVVVIFSADSENWEVLPADAVVLNADGSVTLRLPAMGTVAFLVEKTAQNDAVVTAP